MPSSREGSCYPVNSQKERNPHINKFIVSKKVREFIVNLRGRGLILVYYSIAIDRDRVKPSYVGHERRGLIF